MTEFLDTLPRPLLYVVISVVVFVIYSVPLFSRAYSFLDIGFQVPALFVAAAAVLVGLLHGLIFGAFTGFFENSSIVLSCGLSIAATLILASVTLVLIWLRDPDHPRGEFADYYFGWLKFAVIMFIVPSVLSGSLAGILI